MAKTAFLNSEAAMNIQTNIDIHAGAHMIVPLPGVWPQKPGSASLPFFGVDPVIVDEKVDAVPSGSGKHSPDYSCGSAHSFALGILPLKKVEELLQKEAFFVLLFCQIWAAYLEAAPLNMQESLDDRQSQIIQAAKDNEILCARGMSLKALLRASSV